MVELKKERVEEDNACCELRKKTIFFKVTNFKETCLKILWQQGDLYGREPMIVYVQNANFSRD